MIDHTGRNLYLILIPNSVTDQNDLTQVYCFHRPSILNTEAASSFVPAVNFFHTARRRMPEETILLDSFINKNRHD
jgi:molybdenum cofactor biosynthesis enzyme MoaA